jgi:hypothetical protein
MLINHQPTCHLPCFEIGQVQLANKPKCIQLITKNKCIFELAFNFCLDQHNNMLFIQHFNR